MAFRRTIRYIPPTTAGVYRTLTAMAQMARSGGRTTSLVASAIYDAGSPVTFGVRLRSWLAAHWTETPDPYGVEYVKSPEYQLTTAAAHDGKLLGDCDDLATLGAGLALAAGWRARYCAAVIPPARVPSHVYAVAVNPETGDTTSLDVLDHGRHAPATSALWYNV